MQKLGYLVKYSRNLAHVQKNTYRLRLVASIAIVNMQVINLCLEINDYEEIQLKQLKCAKNTLLLKVALVILQMQRRQNFSGTKLRLTMHCKCVLEKTSESKTI